MKGTILGFDESKSSGMIRGDDGNRYQFVRSEFYSDQAPRDGVEIDFDIENGEAKDIYMVQKEMHQDNNLQDTPSKHVAMTGVSKSPIAIAAMLVYAIAIFLPFVSFTSAGGDVYEIDLWYTIFGKAAFGIAVLMLILIGGDLTKFERPLKTWGGSLLLILIAIAAIAELREINGVVRVDPEDGKLGIGAYILPISALVLIFVPVKKQGEQQ